MIHQAPLLGLCAALSLAWAMPAGAETIELHATDLARAASIHADAPLLSWAGREYQSGTYSAGHLEVSARGSVLLGYALDMIPDDMRITSARWTIPLASSTRKPVKLSLWRVLSDWGPGVSYRYRQTVPEAIEWETPGCGALGVERTLGPTTTILVEPEQQEVTVNVTRDLELWHSGLEPNFGWLLTIEQDQTRVFVESPIYRGFDQWVLRITYEPR